MMHPITLKLETFFTACAKREASIPEDLIEAFGEACKAALRRQFNEPPRPFRVSMSNVGKPLCQLQYEAAGEEGEPKHWYFPMQMLLGDMVEAATMALLKASGVNVHTEQEEVAITLPSGRSLPGTLDLTVFEDGVYDIKSASDWSFNNKFLKGFDTVLASDTFGYVTQGEGYAKAKQQSFRGWIVTNKSTGEICVCEAPSNRVIERDVTVVAEEVLDTLDAKKPIKRCFSDEPELFRKTPTGNRMLGTTCSFCAFKFKCWPSLIVRESIPSSAQNKPLRYYTYIEEEDQGILSQS